MGESTYPARGAVNGAGSALAIKTFLKCCATCSINQVQDHEMIRPSDSRYAFYVSVVKITNGECRWSLLIDRLGLVYGLVVVLQADIQNRRM